MLAALRAIVHHVAVLAWIGGAERQRVLQRIGAAADIDGDVPVQRRGRLEDLANGGLRRLDRAEGIGACAMPEALPLTATQISISFEAKPVPPLALVFGSPGYFAGRAMAWLHDGAALI